jgi:inorganic pyrophosphatase
VPSLKYEHSNSVYGTKADPF